MTPSQYTEDQLVERPGIELFEELGWDHVNAFYETLGPEGTLGRDNKAEVFLTRRLRQAVERLNPGMPAEAVDQAVTEIIKPRTAMHYARANARDPCSPPRSCRGSRAPDGRCDAAREAFRHRLGEPGEQRLPARLAALGPLATCTSGAPTSSGSSTASRCVFIELKASHRNLKHAYDDNLRDYRDTIPHLFIPNGFIVLSNGAETKVGTITSSWELLLRVEEDQLRG